MLRGGIRGNRAARSRPHEGDRNCNMEMERGDECMLSRSLATGGLVGSTRWVVRERERTSLLLS